MNFDPNLDPPPEHILQAARAVSNWMTMQGHRDWQLDGICDRNIAYKLGVCFLQHKLLTAENIDLRKRVAMASCQKVVNEAWAKRIADADLKLANNILQKLNDALAAELQSTRDEYSYTARRVMREKNQEIAKLRAAFLAAQAFIASHVADPDITDNMAEKYAAYQKASNDLEP